MPQQATMRSALMEGIERMNTVVVRGTGAGEEQNMGVPQRRDPFTIDIDHGRNCYACGRFGHMARNCRNRGQRGRVAENRKVEYEGGRIEEIVNVTNNLKKDKNLELLN